MSKSTTQHRKLMFRREAIATLCAPELRAFEPGAAATLHGCTRTNDDACKTK